MRKIKICFISLNSYPLFDLKSKGYFGGSELQISLIVKELVKDSRFETSLIVGDYGQKNKIKRKNLKIYKCFRKKSHIFKETLFFLKTLKEINADLYVERTVNMGVGIVSLFCKIFRKKFIYMVAHNWDCQKNFPGELGTIAKSFYYFGLKRADLIISQTKDQQKRLLKNFELESIIMRSVTKPQKAKKNYKKDLILWVGRADDWKQPFLFIKLAKAFSQEKFVMVCRKGRDENFYYRIKRKAREAATNLTFYSFIPINEIVKFFARAKIFVNTSIAEGFPNTFLQSGLAKTPIVSLGVNPDNFIRENHCGFWAENSFSKMNDCLKILLNDADLRKRMSENNYEYVSRKHDLKNVGIFKKQVLKIVYDE